MLEFINVNGTGKDFCLKNINFTAQTGFITGITGANGAGKSTLFRYISDKTKHYDGEIRYCGKNIREDFSAFQNLVGVVSDEKRFFEEFTANQNTHLLSVFYKEWSQEIFKEKMNQMGVSMNRPLSKFSRGEYIKFQLAFAAAHHAKLYLLDEATAGMDPVFRKDFYKFLHELIATEDVTILITTHIEEEIQSQLDYIGILEKGKMISFDEVEVS